MLTAVIHVMDRSEPSEKRLQQCAQLCSTFSSQKALSSSYRSTLLHSIEKMCAPNDTYTACIYHTMKFDVNEDSRWALVSQVALFESELNHSSAVIFFFRNVLLIRFSTHGVIPLSELANNTIFTALHLKADHIFCSIKLSWIIPRRRWYLEFVEEGFVQGILWWEVIICPHPPWVLMR